MNISLPIIVISERDFYFLRTGSKKGFGPFAELGDLWKIDSYAKGRKS